MTGLWFVYLMSFAGCFLISERNGFLVNWRHPKDNCSEDSVHIHDKMYDDDNEFSVYSGHSYLSTE